MSGFDVLGPIGVGGPEGLKPLRPQSLREALQDGVDGTGESSGFGATLKGALEKVIAQQQEVKDKFDRLSAGEPVELHEIMSAMGKSEVTFNLMLEVRNKFIEAYERLSRSVV